MFAVQVRVLHLDAVWQMRAEYQNAIVHQARVQQAQRVFEDPEKATKLEDSVKSAMCPFLVLEIRRDHLIEDTLHQINKKVLCSTQAGDNFTVILALCCQ